MVTHRNCVLVIMFVFLVVFFVLILVLIFIFIFIVFILSILPIVAEIPRDLPIVDDVTVMWWILSSFLQRLKHFFLIAQWAKVKTSIQILVIEVSALAGISPIVLDFAAVHWRRSFLADGTDTRLSYRRW